MLTLVPTSPGKGSLRAGFGSSRYASPFWASCPYSGLPVRSLRRVHSSTSVPMVARLLVLDPFLMYGDVGSSSLSGTPLGVSKAIIRYWASRSACSSTLGADSSLSACFASGPLSRSYAVRVTYACEQVRPETLRHTGAESLTREETSEVPNGGLEERDASHRRAEVDLGDEVQDLVHDLVVPHDQRGGQGIHRTCAPAIAVVSSDPASRRGGRGGPRLTGRPRTCSIPDAACHAGRRTCSSRPRISGKLP